MRTPENKEVTQARQEAIAAAAALNPKEILRTTGACAPPGLNEIRAAIGHGDNSPLHLGAVMIGHCAGYPDDIIGYDRVAVLDKKIGTIDKSSTRIDDRQKQMAPLGAEVALLAADAARHGVLLDFVRTEQVAFYRQYRLPDGKLNTTALGVLYDATDERQHAAVSAIDQRLAEVVDVRFRTVLITTDHLVRFMVERALAQPAVS